MDDVNLWFCYKHFTPLKGLIRKMALQALDAKVSDRERRKLDFICQGVWATSFKTQIMLPIVMFIPIILNARKTKTAIFVKTGISLVLALSIKPVLEGAKYVGTLIAMPRAINLLIADKSTGSFSSQETMKVLEMLKNEQVEAQKSSA